MDIKSLILLAGGVMIVAVIVHGIWIAWKARKNSLGMDIIPDALLDDAEPAGRYPAELPNGGARVVGLNDIAPRRREKPPILMTPTGDTGRAPSAEGFDAGFADGTDADVDAELFGTADELVTEDRRGAPRPGEKDRPEPARTRNGYHPSARSRGPGQTSTIEAAMENANGIANGNGNGSGNGSGNGDGAPAGMNTRQVRPAASGRDPAAPRSRVAEVNVGAAPKPVKKRDSLRSRSEEAVTTEDREERSGGNDSAVISIYLIARRGTMIEGQRLYEALKMKGIRFGEMQIFHRVDPGSKLSLYSVANAVNPGTFDFAKINVLKVPGIVFFMQLEGLDHPVQVFEDMRRVASDVAEMLGCEIKDENRSVVGPQTFDHYRERIAEYARRRLSRRALS